MIKDNYVIVIAGGKGSRLWPFSRKDHPKQFQDLLNNGKTLIQQVVARFEGICPKENIYISTNDSYEPIIRDQLPFITEDAFLLEPVMRNTAPCIAYAANKILVKNPNANLIITPSDHIILGENEFKKDIIAVLDVTSKHDILAVLGIEPNQPNTGYGYIQVSEKKKIGLLNKVKIFTEKPDISTARKFIETGEFVWNAGIFIAKAKTMLEQFEKYLPEINQPFLEIKKDYYTPKEKESVKKAFCQCRNISIDYGIMEKAENVYVLRANFGWSDLGTWKSVYEVSIGDSDNVINGNVLNYNTHGCIIKTSSDRLIVTEGLENYIIVEKDNILLICPMLQEQKVKSYVEDAREKFGKKFT